MNLSIVIPVYNESQKIGRDVAAAGTFLEKEGLTGEIIVVDDGSEDDTSGAAMSVNLPPDVSINVIRYTPNRGKGYAIRAGMARTRGEYIMFADSGSCVPYDNALAGLALLRENRCDLAHGSRKLPDSIIRRPQVWYRRILSRLFHWLVILWMKVPALLSDTQCGFKLYKGDVGRRLYGECQLDGFMFDIEIILLALKGQLRIREFPVDWTSDPDSRLSVTRSPRGILMELQAIKASLASR